MQRLRRGNHPPTPAAFATLGSTSLVRGPPLLIRGVVCRSWRRARRSSWVRVLIMVTVRDRYTDRLPAGNRWHIDCFRCNTCQTLLDSDANLLLLGDGSLICNNCTYSCSACGNKIEDLAILTGDQAFCATCFRCRVCKKKIENLKYARTSQGMFCMECHESLMQRRRKKSAKNGAHRRDKHGHNHHQGGNMLLHKSLPSLPPSAIEGIPALSPDNESLASEGYSDTPTELPRISQSSGGKAPTSKTSSLSGTPTEPPRRSQRRPQLSRSNSSRSTKRERSPAAREDDPKGTVDNVPHPLRHPPSVELTGDRPPHPAGHNVQGESRVVRGGPVGERGRVLHPAGL